MNIEIRHTLLLIDDEPEILSSLNRLLRREYHVLLANSAQEGLEFLGQHEIHVILTDQRMPEMEGVEFLEAIKGKFPDAIPMLLTGYADVESVIAAINSGNVYRYLVKPWNPNELLATIKEACHKYDLIVQNRQLTQDLIVSNKELEGRVKERTAMLERTNNYIMALNQIGIQLQANLNHDKVIKTLEAELIKRQLTCLVALCDFENHHESSNNNEHSIDTFQEEETLKDCHLQLKEIPDLKEIIEQQRASFVPDMQTWSARVLSYFPDTVPASMNSLLGMDSGLKGAVLPLFIRQKSTGILMIWGNNLIESDLLALSVFANQVGIALENATLFEAIHSLAMIDGLTGVYNRRRIIELAQQEFARAKRTRHPFSVMMIDVDDFKRVNDTYGHGIGDLVLRSITKRCQEALRKEVDMLGRYGGDEFLILLPETDLSMGREIAARLHTHIQRQSIDTDLGPISTSISLGVSSLTDQVSRIEDLLNLADQAMYQAKQVNKVQ